MHYHGITKKIVNRPLLNNGAGLTAVAHPILKRLYQSRGITSDAELERGLKKLPSPWLLSNMDDMAQYLISAIDRQKKIVIGEKGEQIKIIGRDARKDMEKLFESKIMLNLWVKVKRGWSDDERALKSLGYHDE